MDYAVLKKIAEYSDVYEVAALGISSVEEMKAALKKKGATGGTFQRRTEYLTGQPAYISINGDELSYDYQTLAEDLQTLKENLIPKGYGHDTEQELEEEIEMLKRQIADLTSELQEYSQKITQQEDYISKLKAELSKRAGGSLKTELERKVLVASSISVGPKVHPSDECFLVDPDELLDVDACVARYGGELDSFYEEIPTDTEDAGFEPGHELTEKNHALRTMKTVGTKRFFSKRVKDNAEVKKVQSRVGQLFPAHGDGKSERQKERDKILRNRFISLNNIIKSDRLTNQEKLMMYAMNSEYHNTHIERLLTYAGAHCINADFLIYILEDPDTCSTYENTVAFLSQFADASEYRMKLNLARELIEGKWYITADYNGRKTKFQLVPIDEINELRKGVGLPISKYSYKEEEEDDPFPDDVEEEVPKKPDFVEDIAPGSYGDIDIPDDGFEMPQMDNEELPF